MSIKSEKAEKSVKGLPKLDRERIDAFFSQDQPLNKKGKPTWDKAEVKKLTHFEMCKEGDGTPVLMYNDGKQRFGLTIKSWSQYAQVKGDLLLNFVNKVDYLDALAKYIFNSEGSNATRINSI